MCTDSRRSRFIRGFSLPEVILFIVIIAIAITGILLVMNQVTAHSADALARKQALALAESLLEEIELQAVSGVVPNPATPVNADRSVFDNVYNYQGYTTSGGVRDLISNAPIVGLSAYDIAPPVSVAAVPVSWGGLPAGSAVLIQVHVSGPAGQIDVTGYRTGP